MLPSLKIGKYVAKYPIIQGGMAVRISGASLAAAVANYGGVGIIATAGLGLNSPYFEFKHPENYFQANEFALIDELKKAQRLSPNGIMGVNCMVALTDYEAVVRTSVENGAQIVVSGAGLPLKLPLFTKDFPNVALVPIVSSVRAAKVICAKWDKEHHRLPDAIIVENPNTAGGHLGASRLELGKPEYELENIIPAILEYLKNDLKVNIPVIAAGGIWDRTDIDHMLSLGYAGVQMATRFVTTHECDAPDNYKNLYLQSTPEDVIIVDSPVGLPGRALRNSFVDKVIPNPSQKMPCLVTCLHKCSFRTDHRDFCIMFALNSAQKGQLDQGLVFCGTNAYRCKAITSVKQVMDELTNEEQSA